MWLKTYNPTVAEENEALQARFEQGNDVGDLAMYKYRKILEKNTKIIPVLSLFQKAFQQKSKEIGEGVELPVPADVLVAKLYAVFHIRIIVPFDEVVDFRIKIIILFISIVL